MKNYCKYYAFYMFTQHLPAMITKLTELKLCTIVLHVVPLHISKRLYASVQNKFPTDITKLTTQLTRRCNHTKEHCCMLNDLTSNIVLKRPAAGSVTCTSMNIARKVISKKLDGTQRRGSVNTEATSTVGHGGDGTNHINIRGYEVCQKYSTNHHNAWKTHPTEPVRNETRLVQRSLLLATTNMMVDISATLGRAQSFLC